MTGFSKTAAVARRAAARCGDALAEQALDHEVDRAQVGQQVPGDGQLRRLGQQFAQLADGQRAGQPRPGCFVPRPDTDVGVPALVARTGATDRAERLPFRSGYFDVVTSAVTPDSATTALAGSTESAQFVS